MIKKLIILLSIFIGFVSYSQSVIEVSHPEDADVIVYQVFDSLEADVVICVTEYSAKARQWDCMWKFKKWGFSNLSIFIVSDTLSLCIEPEEEFEDEPTFYPYDVKIYFTEYEDERGYRKENFSIPGIMRVK